MKVLEFSPLKLKLAALGLATMFSLALGELAARVLLQGTLSAPKGDSFLRYQYDQKLGWFPVANSTYQVSGCRTITATHNSDGFRGPEKTPAGQPAILFLGDSFVWGYDVEAAERFTEKLQKSHPEWPIYNLGVCGYGTDQELLLLQEHFDRFQPAVVFLVFCSDNDHDDNAINLHEGGYYKPYYCLDGATVKLCGVPVPRSERVFGAEHKILCASYLVRLMVRAYYHLMGARPIRSTDPTGELILAMKTFVNNKGALLVAGVEGGPHVALKNFLETCSIPYVDLDNRAAISLSLFWSTLDSRRPQSSRRAHR